MFKHSHHLLTENPDVMVPGCFVLQASKHLFPPPKKYVEPPKCYDRVASNIKGNPLYSKINPHD